jgi:hypothetical protein
VQHVLRGDSPAPTADADGEAGEAIRRLVSDSPDGSGLAEGDATSRPPRKVRVKFGPATDVELLYAQVVVSNFTGSEFLISFVQARPPIFTSPDEIPDEVESKVVARIVVSPAKWAEAVDALAKQVKSLREQNVLPPAEESIAEEG